MTSFYTHRKTVKLKIALGTDAYWIPPRLWAYAAENQPDGNFSAYASDEIAELLGCPKHASSILQALKGCGFIDESTGVIHDWAEHNGYHESFSKRAKKAAEARWKKKEETGKGKEEQALLKHAPSINKTSATLSEVKIHFESLLLPESDALWFFHKCEGNGWTNGGKPIKAWKSVVTSWKHAGYLPSQKNNGRAKPAARADGHPGRSFMPDEPPKSWKGGNL